MGAPCWGGVLPRAVPGAPGSPASKGGGHRHVAKSRRPRSMCCGVLAIAACQILSAAISCVPGSWVMNTLLPFLLQCRRREDAGWCLRSLPRSYVNVYWNYFVSGYRVIFRLWNWEFFGQEYFCGLWPGNFHSPSHKLGLELPQDSRKAGFREQSVWRWWRCLHWKVPSVLRYYWRRNADFFLTLNQTCWHLNGEKKRGSPEYINGVEKKDIDNMDPL